MELLYVQEHLSCLNYQKGESPLIEYINLSDREEWIHVSGVHKIIFITSGMLGYSYPGQENKRIDGGKIVFLSAGQKIRYTSFGATSMVLFRINKEIQLCDRFRLSQLKDMAKSIDPDNKAQKEHLEIKECIWQYLNILNSHISKGLKCYHYFDLKINELLFLFRGYYTKEELIHLFYPLISEDETFTHLVLTNYRYAKNVKELAAMVNYSVSGFEKHFRKTFSVSAGKWLKEKRSINIYHEINSSNKSLKNICSDFGFSSVTYFNDYCKAKYGLTPGEIRRQIKKDWR